MNAELDTDGVLVVQGALDRETVAALRERVIRSFARSQSPTVMAWGGLPAREVELDQVVQRLKKTVFEHIGRFQFSRRISFFRRHDGGRTHVGWHIDADAAGTLYHDPCFNVWLPLDSVGESLPGLQFIPGSHKVMRTLPLLDLKNAERSEKWVRERFGDVLTPVLLPGDVVVFSHYTLHRTQPIPGFRLSGELRFIGSHVKWLIARCLAMLNRSAHPR